MAVGEDNQYLNVAVRDTSAQEESTNALGAENSAYCRHFPGSAAAVKTIPRHLTSTRRISSAKKTNDGWKRSAWHS